MRTTIIPFPFCFGMTFVKYYKLLKKSENWNEKEIKEYQTKKLKKLLKIASETEYYKKIIKKNNINVEKLKLKEFTEKIPILDKDTVRKQFDKLQNKRKSRFFPELFKTSGSTGEPLKYSQDYKTRMMTLAQLYRQYRRAGIKKIPKTVVFRGALVDEKREKRKKKTIRQGKEIHFSTFDLDPETIKKYVNKINKIKPDLIRGYPSSIYVLAQEITKSKIKLDFKLKAIHCSSEVITPSQEKTIKKAFRCKILNWYSHGEGTVSAGNCGLSRKLHLNEEFGYTEFIETEEKGTYKIISTSLFNYSMPFIRYDTEDLAILSKEKCVCGRNGRIIKEIIGRNADIIKGKNGKKVAPSTMVHYWKFQIDTKTEGIKYTQVLQDKKLNIIIRMVGKKTKKNEDIIANKVKDLLGKDTDVTFKYLKNIPTGEKWRFTKRI